MATWSPTTYLQFADERSRPFFDLIARVRASAPRTVADLGCGPGQLTATLSGRWPSAMIEGIDSSPQMIEAAAGHATGHVRFTLGDVLEWRPESPVDVIVSNATLQWVPGHRALLRTLLDGLAPNGWLAFQVPWNFDWISGTGARPNLQALGDAQRGEFVEEYSARLRAAYPASRIGTLLPFRRVFVVGQKQP